MKGLLAFLRLDLTLHRRSPRAAVLNLVVPLLIFVPFAMSLHAARRDPAEALKFMLLISIVSQSVAGAGVRLMAEREQGILRRFRVAPLSPAEILTARVLSGTLLFLPALLLVLFIGRQYFGLHVSRGPSLLALTVLGLLAFRAVGLVLAVVSNTQDMPFTMNLVMLPMLLLSSVPLESVPRPLAMVAWINPATRLTDGLAAILVRGEPLSIATAVALLATAVVGIAIAAMLFRWEKEEKAPRAAKWGLVVFTLPVIALVGWGLLHGDPPAPRPRHEAPVRDVRQWDGQIVVRTDGELLTLDPRTRSTSRLAVRGLRDVTSLAATPALFGLDEARSMTVLRRRGDAWLPIELPADLAGVQFRPFELLAQADELVLFSRDETFVRQADAWRRVPRQRPPFSSGFEVRQVVLSGSHVYVLGGEQDGVAALDLDSGQWSIERVSPSIRSLAVSPAGQLWAIDRSAANLTALLRLRDGAWEPFAMPTHEVRLNWPLPFATFEAMAFDADGHLCVLTPELGVVRHDGQAWQRLTPGWRAGPKVTALAMEPDVALIGTEDHGLLVWDLKRDAGEFIPLASARR
jgi:ABC-type polysaccharide/polyol phosphate export permease